MALYRARLRELAAEALLNSTIAEDRVFTARSWPITPADTPAIYLQIPDDEMTSTGRNAGDFVRVSDLAIRGAVCGGTPGKCQLLLEAMAEQIELSLMYSVEFQSALSQISYLRTNFVVSSEAAEHIGELRMLAGLEYFESYPPIGAPLREITGKITTEASQHFAGLSVKFPEN
ncbi:hypothetical protein GOB93_03290 [Acetobacter musti]|uniref:Phage protein n=1 Tax=Acetobacter musti TaxID=864732 RepID=A0ABX0JPV9_9PROT|nr:hypothetical protein [Acetobacter musti]NHN83664.1 hypothetical protein [Acetobacter musti]